MTAELVACPKCDRKNNALRPTCIYCGAQLPVAQEISADLVANRTSRAREIDAKAELDPISQISTQLQNDLAGYNLIILPVAADQQARAIDAITAVAPFNADEARQLLELGWAMPLLRFQHEIEAKAIYDRLRSGGLPVIIVSDDKLHPEEPNRRLKRLTLMPGAEGTTLTLQMENSAAPTQTVSAKEIRLIVEGKIRYRQTEATEENKGFGKRERELTGAVEFMDEQPILDLYLDSLETSFRIRAEAFDYSGLGTKMKLTTLENFRQLLTTIREIATAARYDNDFKQCTKLLDPIWPPQRRNQSLGLRRSQLLTAGKIATRSAIYIDNEMQFNRYSRLRYYLMRNETSTAE